MGLNEKVTKVTFCKLLSRWGPEAVYFSKTAAGSRVSPRKADVEEPRRRGKVTRLSAAWPRVPDTDGRATAATGCGFDTVHTAHSLGLPLAVSL